MKEFILLSAFGKDQPGMVAGITHVLFELGANLEDTSMTRLGGEFTMMLVISVPKANKTKLIKGFEKFGRSAKLALFAKEIAPALARVQRGEPTHLISVYGTDRPGIVYRIAQVLANRKINITDLNTKTMKRAGTSFYVMLLEVQIPPKMDIDELTRQLHRLSELLSVEITLRDIEPVAL